MRTSIWPAPGTPWPELLALAGHCEAQGFDGLWLADHFMPNEPDPSGPVHEAWTTLAALAARVPRLRVGTLVSGNTYRHPAVLAKMAAQVDVVSGGRMVLGVGAGWQENEHRAYGIPFPPLRERLERLEEACAVLRALLGRERSDFEGRYYALRDAPLEPRPVQARLPLLVGGGGERVTLRIAARHADEWNTWATPEVLAHKGAVLERHCEAVGRDPKSIARCAVALVRVSADPDEAARAAREPASGARVVGTVEQLREAWARYAEVGCDELVVPTWGLGRGTRRDEALDALRDVAADFR